MCKQCNRLKFRVRGCWKFHRYTAAFDLDESQLTRLRSLRYGYDEASFYDEEIAAC